jgi:hypothetical protein
MKYIYQMYLEPKNAFGRTQMHPGFGQNPNALFIRRLSRMHSELLNASGAQILKTRMHLTPKCIWVCICDRTQCIWGGPKTQMHLDALGFGRNPNWVRPNAFGFETHLGVSTVTGVPQLCSATASSVHSYAPPG